MFFEEGLGQGYSYVDRDGLGSFYGLGFLYGFLGNLGFFGFGVEFFIQFDQF